MIYKSLRLNLDIDQLKEHLQKFVFCLEPETQSPEFGGWSVLSTNGSYKDGWHKGHLFHKLNPIEKQKVIDSIKNSGPATMPTEICHGYLKDVITTLTSLKLQPYRTRIIRLTAKSKSTKHRDGDELRPLYRLHIPIITNELCFFECESGRAHLPADGSAHLIRVNQMHQVFNDGRTDRFHLVTDIHPPEELVTEL